MSVSTPIRLPYPNMPISEAAVIYEDCLKENNLEAISLVEYNLEYYQWRREHGFDPNTEQILLLNTMYIESCLVAEIFGKIGSGTGSF